ncbi:MAG: TetR/AcrR family transcriptional regulator [Blastomonas sp.]|uniref:TetR/AcrR family transcriptional regulator n=1 Tax=Blastomonas sp. TaxID=1909299 RepID=UPI00258CAD3A|nr:TetR/AcrR family transcriptional regulator [Blastomonas sp.]MCO5793190.1 TetR/AcrR family transcriptional regulator [Blastomonas sp.]
MRNALLPRKAPLQARARASYEAILEAATQIIASRGLAGFNTNAVAERAGVSIGSLYQYFPNKDALMVALIRQQQERQGAAVRAAVEATGTKASLEFVVRTIIRAAMRNHYDNELLAAAIDHEEARLPIKDRLDDYLASLGADLAGFLRRFSSEIRPEAVERGARTLPALVRGVVDAWADLAPAQLDIAEEEAVAAVLGYLRGGPGTTAKATAQNS